MKTTTFIATFIISCGTVLGQLNENAASTIIKQINTITSDYTETLVIPTNRKDGVIVLSMKGLQTEKVRKFWIFIASSAIGKYMNDHPELSINEILFTDILDMKARPARYSVLDISVAKLVQKKIHAGEMELEDGMEKVWTSLVKKTKEIK